MNQAACPDAAVRVTEPHQGVFVIPGKLALEAPRREQVAALKLRLSHAASLITSERFKAPSTSENFRPVLSFGLLSATSDTATITSPISNATSANRLLIIAPFLYVRDCIRGSARFI